MPHQNLVINADDWGRDRDTTDRTFDCLRHGSVSRASAMVFMGDSERAAALARDSQVDTGLHLNLTTPFSARNCTPRLLEHHVRVMRFLRRHFLNRAIFNPFLASSFEYVVSAQFDEYERLYGTRPARLDGHHHMHLCANVAIGKLLPRNLLVRRNFSREPGERKLFIRALRSAQDQWLQSKYQTTDFFFALPPISSERLERIIALAANHTVELETHPIVPEEYEFLMSNKMSSLAAKVTAVA